MDAGPTVSRSQTGSSMSTVLLSGDWHLHNWPRFSRTLSGGMNSRLAQQLDVISQIGRYVEERRPDYFIFGGDWTERRHFCSFSILDPARRATIAITRLVKHSYILMGNHDMEDTEGTYSSVGQLWGTPNVTVIDRPGVHKLGDLRAFLCPYMTQNRVVDAFYNQPAADIAVAHYAADGKVLESEYVLPSPLKKDLLTQYRRTFFHHVHSPSDEGQIIYVGAPQHYDFGDVGSRYCVLYDTDNDKVQWLPLRYPEFVTAKYPRIPVRFPEDGPGFLRVLGAPRGELEDVRRSAVDAGWEDSLVLAEAVPAEAVQLVMSNLAVDEQVLSDYVREHYGHLGDEAARQIFETGLGYIAKAQGA